MTTLVSIFVPLQFKGILCFEPKLKLLREKNADRVTSYLAEIYPALFKVDESQDVQASKVGYGLGGVKGLKNLSKVICQRVL